SSALLRLTSASPAAFIPANLRNVAVRAEKSPSWLENSTRSWMRFAPSSRRRWRFWPWLSHACLSHHRQWHSDARGCHAAGFPGPAGWRLDKTQLASLVLSFTQVGRG